MKLIILSAEKQILCEEAGLVELPGALGRFTVLPGHAPLITSLVPGVVRYAQPGGTGHRTVSVKGGFAEVKNDEITVCVD